MLRLRWLMSFMMLALVAVSLPLWADGRVLVILNPNKAMGNEFFGMMDVFEEYGIDVDVAGQDLGTYDFMEDTLEGTGSGLQTGYEWTIALTYDAIDLSLYDVLIMGPAHAHTFGFSGPRSRIVKDIVAQAAEEGMPLGGLTFGATFLVTNGYLDGRYAADPPFYVGVLSEEAHMTGFLSLYDALYKPDCVWVDYGVEGQSTIVTANFQCIESFALTIIEEFLSD